MKIKDAIAIISQEKQKFNQELNTTNANLIELKNKYVATFKNDMQNYLNQYGQSQNFLNKIEESVLNLQESYSIEYLDIVKLAKNNFKKFSDLKLIDSEIEKKIESLQNSTKSKSLIKEKFQDVLEDVFNEHFPLNDKILDLFKKCINQTEKEKDVVIKMTQYNFLIEKIVEINKQNDELNHGINVFSCYQFHDNLIEKKWIGLVKDFKNQSKEDWIEESKQFVVDEKSIHHAQLALKAVKTLMNKWCQDSEYELEHLYLLDAKDHLDLAKYCLANDKLNMYERSHMDTSSRELIDEQLWDFFISEEFLEDVKALKKKKAIR